MIDTLMVLFRRWFRREPPSPPLPAPPVEQVTQPATAPPSLDIEQALRSMYRHGKEAGRRETAVVYTACCPAHEIPMEHDVLFGYYHCPLCVAERRHLWQPEDERVTSQIELAAIRPLPANRFLQKRQEEHPDAGPMTQQHRVVHWDTLQKPH